MCAIDGISGVSTEGDTLVIGAATTHAEVAGNADVQRLYPALAFLAGGIGDPAIRYSGTIGGSIANNDPAADYPAGFLALDATIVANKREIASDDCFDGVFASALDDDDIITSVRVNAPKCTAYVKFRRPASLFALVGVCAADGACGRNRRRRRRSFQHAELEAALSVDWAAAVADSVSFDGDGQMSDMHGSAEYRANLIKVLTKRAVDAS